MTARLPPELFREVVGHYTKADDLEALQVISLVSPIFREPCQEIIFSDILVHKQRFHRNRTAHHLAGLDILRRNPSLIGHIKELTVHQSKGGPILWDYGAMEPCFGELLCLLASAPIQGFTYVGWEGTTSPEFQDGIIALVRSPTLTCLNLRFIPAGLVKMVKSSSIQSLTLTDLEEYSMRPPNNQLFPRPFPSSSGIRAMRPTSLTLAPDSAIIHALTSSIDMTATKELTLTDHAYAHKGIECLLAACGAPFLRTLRLDLDG